MTLYKFILKYPAKHWPLYLSGLITLIITNITTTIIPLKIKDIINILSTHSSETITQHIYILIGLSAILLVSRTFSRILIFFPGRFVEYRLRNNLFTHLQTLSQGYFNSQKIGDIMSKLTNDVKNLRLMSALGFLHIINTIMIYTFVLYNMIKMNMSLTFYTLIPVPIILIVVKLFAGKMHGYHAKSTKELGEITDFFVESLGNIQVLKTTLSEDAFNEELNKQNSHFMTINLTLSKIRAIMFPFIGIISSLGLIILFFVGGADIINGKMAIGDFVAFSAYLTLLAWPTASFAWIINIVQRGTVSLKRISEILDTKPDICDSDITNFTINTPPTIQIKNLSLSIDRTSILKNISLTINKSETLGIFGPTGSGKTILSQVITRVLPIDKNTLFFDGQDCHTIPLNEVRSAISYVPQNAFLFSDTIKENIAYCTGEAKANIDKINHAITSACVKDDIQKFPKKDQTIIGEKGIILSGGQKNRIALARAYYKPHHILVLDDILSAVDHKTEADMIQALSNDPNCPTTLIISHRLSALKHADSIIVLENGQITDQGTHEELIQKKGIYANTWAYQQMEMGDD